MAGVGDVMTVKGVGLEMLAASAAGNTSVQSADFSQVMQKQSMGSNTETADSTVQKPAADANSSTENAQQTVTAGQDSVDSRVQQAETSDLTETAKTETPEKAIVKLVTEVLGVDEETLETLMSQLGILPPDLFQPENMQQLVLAVNGGTDVMDLLTSEAMMSELQDLMQGMKELETTIELPEEFADSLLQSTDVEMSMDAEPAVTVDSDEKVIPVVIEKDAKAELPQKVPESDAQIGQETVQKTVPAEQKTLAQDDSQEESLPQYETGQTELPEESSHNAQTVNPFNQFVTEAVREPQMVQPPSQTVQIIEQIVQQIRISVQLTTTTMEMQLNPESLGKVLLSVSMKEGMMTAHFTVQTEEARMAIESQMYTLRETLEQKELKVDAVEVTVSDFSFTHEEEGDQKNLEQGDGKSRRFRFEEDEEDETETTAQEDAERVRRSVMRDNGSSVDFTA